MENEKVIYTNGIPVCPNCNKPTKRSSLGSSITCVYFKPVYDENGNNINPDRNTISSCWQCLECNNKFAISGNDVDGFKYDK